ncbi:DNA repair protein REV1 isoform X2 [Folsomia candida]|nr:DNA repair protein REV1 isoform X2 [Folsomia candida]
MEAKKAKLDLQLNKNSSKKIGNDPPSGINLFNGLSVYVNGYTDPPEPKLRKLFVQYGGQFHPYRNAKTDFIIASNLSKSSKSLYGGTTVKPEWITDSIAAGVQLNYRDYLLYDLNKENNQLTLTQMMGNQRGQSSISRISKSNESLDVDVAGVLSVACDTTGEDNPAANTTSISNDDDDNIIQLPSNEDNNVQDEALLPCDEDNAVNSQIMPENDESGGLEEFIQVNESLSTHTAPVNGKKIKTAAEDGFLEDFFGNSRLHLISDQKKDMQNKIGTLRKAIDSHTFEYFDEFKHQNDQNNNFSVSDILVDSVILMHIDMDCFFVSVGLLSRPHLRGKPTVVTHSTGKNSSSMSDIASASYEARQFGVRNGMWVSDAMKLCPELEVIPYDFEEYRRVSGTFLDVVSKITLDIEPSSVDEMVIDATPILKKVPGSSPRDLAEFIRTKIFEAVKCTASVGIGSNKLLAKLATKKAKPNGVHHLKVEDAQDFIQDLEVRELPGIGWSTESKLQDVFNAKTCKDLLQIPMQNLSKVVGPKTAENIVKSCKAIGPTELKYGFDRPQSISLDVNFGIRFTNIDQLFAFLMKLCKELSARATRAQATGSQLSIRIMSRKKGAGEPKKQGGHGIVDTISRSTRLFQPTNDWSSFYRVVSKIVKLLPIPIADYRGVGFSLSTLTFEFDKSSNQKKTVQRTLLDLASSRGRQMLECAKKSSNKRGLASQNVTPLPLPPQQQVADDANCLSPPDIKRRKLDFKSIVRADENKASPKPKPALKSAISDTGDVDLNVLRELPEDIGREIALQYKIDYSLVQQQNSDSISVNTVEDDITTTITKSKANSPSNNEKMSSETRINDSKNPYSEIDVIDPTYLCALPEAIRNEVLLQFQEAKKGRQIDSVTVAQDEPCSSRQALERDNALKSHIVNDTEKSDPEQCKKDASGPSHLVCDEVMHDEFECTTPPQILSVPRSSTSQRRFQSRQSKSTHLSSRRRLNFEVHDTSPPSIPSHEIAEKFDIHRFWTDNSYMPLPPEPVCTVMPALNGAVGVEETRNVIRLGISSSLYDPTIYDSEDAETLRGFFRDLIQRGYIKQGHLLLKYISRKHKTLPQESQWRRVIEEIVTSVQLQFIELYGGEVNLES